jgi:dihydroorotase
MSKLIIRNGRVMDPASSLDAIRDVAIEDGRIAAIGQNMDAAGATELDASGLIVAPGFIDMHVHLREPGFEHAETIESGSRAAAAGGFTSICCMPNTSPVNDNATVTSYIIERAGRHAVVNVFPIGAITKGSAGEQLAAIGLMKEAGIVAISDDGRPVMNARVMRRAMETARSFGLPVIDHCEDMHLSAGGDMNEGVESVRLGLRGIPAASEDVMVARDILLAELTGARFHVAHISSRHSVEMVAFAKARGLSVTSEATPHHFALSDMPAYDSNYKMKPPLRSACDVAAIAAGLVSGAIDAIATDHAPHAGSEKMQEFEQCPFGILGLETAIGITLERLVHPGKITLMRMIELFTTGPDRVLNLNRGRLAVGAPADVTLFDTERSWVYDVNRSASKSRNSPFDGRTFRGGPVATLVDGKVVWSADHIALGVPAASQ